MIDPTRPAVIDPEHKRAILDKVMPDVMELLNQFKTQLGGVLPEEISYGIVAGYMRGRGHTWEESFVAMHQWIVTMKTHYADKLTSVEGTMTIHGSGDRAQMTVTPKTP